MLNDIINFDCMPCKYWSINTRISYLQRRIIVHSIIYYKFNRNCISDSNYDALSQQLIRLQQEATKEQLNESNYYYVMYDFEGSTGFHLFGRLNDKDKEYLMIIARNVIREYEKRI